MLTDADKLGMLWDHGEGLTKWKPARSDYHCTLEEVALALQKDEGTEKPLSRERIRQIERKALLKLRRMFIKKGMADDLALHLFPDHEPHDCAISPPEVDVSTEASWRLQQKKRLLRAG